MSLVISNLAIEVTRKCQFECEHCLRGPRENLVFDPRFLRDFVKSSGLTHLSSITFTGGEPSLDPMIIQLLTNILLTKDIDIGSFYIATNGFEVTGEFLNVILHLYNNCSDNESSQVAFSNTIFHEQEWKDLNKKFPTSIPSLLEIFKIVTPKYSDKFQLNWDNLILEGRGMNGNGRDPDPPTEILYDKEGDDIYIEEPTIYLNCEGNVIVGCDYSYETQRDEDFILCKASEFSMDKINDWNENFKEEVKKK